MAGISYTNEYFYISQQSPEVQTVRNSGDKIGALRGLLERQLQTSCGDQAVREQIYKLLGDYYDNYDSVVENADQGFGIKFNLPWQAVALGDNARVSASSIRSRRPPPTYVPGGDQLTFIPYRP